MLFSQSCISFIGLTDGYKGLSSSNKNLVFTLKEKESFWGLVRGNKSIVLLVSAEDIKDIVSQSKKKYQIVYSYNPHCPSDICVPISTFISYCEEYNAEPIVLSRYLDDILFEQRFIDGHIYAMDPKKYGTRFVYRYAPQFLSEIVGEKVEEDGKPFLLFRNGAFIGKGDEKDILKWLSNHS